jgi:outer membrane protein insertion porin family
VQIIPKGGRGWRLPLIKPNNAGIAANITIPVEEGRLYHLRNMNFVGVKLFRTPEILMRPLFGMGPGDVFSTEKLRKGIEAMRKTYGQFGFIDFVPEPNFEIVPNSDQIDLTLTADEGKQFFIRRIDFSGNTTTRDKVIRREVLLDEGDMFNTQLWDLSILRLNQLGYFEMLKKEDAADIKRNPQTNTVDITLKVKERGKNSIGLNGGVSGIAGSFVGFNYSTNNFLGLGETLSIDSQLGTRMRNVSFGFTEPYFLDRPIQTGFTIFTRKYDFNQAKEAAIQLNQELNVSQEFLNTLQNFSQSSTGFTMSAAYQLRRSFNRVSLTYSFDTSSVTVFSDASRSLFETLAFRNVSGPNALKGVVTSKVIPSFSFSTIDNPQRPHRGNSLYLGGEISGLGGNVAALRPIVEWKQFIPRGAHTIGYRIQGSYITGYRGLVAPPAERFYAGGENDLRGFDIRTLSPYAFLPDVVNLPLQNPDGTTVPLDPTNPRRGNVTVPIPAYRIAFPGGDTNLITNFEYRVPIVGPVSVAAFNDFGLNFIGNPSQLRITSTQTNTLNATNFGCPLITDAFTCGGTSNLPFTSKLKAIAGTNFVPRMSTGLEFQVILPIVNAPFRIYYAYNPLILDTRISSPNQITRSMFPAGGAGDFTYQQAIQLFAPDYRLKEPRKTFRFTVATTF